MGIGVKRFEDLVAWQKARELARVVYDATTQGGFAKDFGLRDQITRAAISVMSNLAEGFERESRTEFHQYIVVAKASCAEVRSDLYLAVKVLIKEHEDGIRSAWRQHFGR
jgi:four helix bundle protein